LCKKHLERRHVILNAVKDLDPAMQVVFECKNEILRLRLRMTCFATSLCFLVALGEACPEPQVEGNLGLTREIEILRS
jgi:hypothetical protein